MLVGNAELLVVLVLVLLLFGGSRLPGLARSLGRARVEFRRGMREED
ncbi:Sec-independent protein translocase subunit TatA/TatB [Candidatus Pyrohabitans sp.]